MSKGDVKRSESEEVIITKGEEEVIKALANVPVGRMIGYSELIEDLGQQVKIHFDALKEKGLIEVLVDENYTMLKHKVDLTEKGWQVAVKLGFAQKIVI